MEITCVEFHEDELEAVRDADGKVWVVVRRACEAIGLDFSGQARRLQSKEFSPWACVAMMKTTLAKDARKREALFLSLDCFPKWLETIDISRVSEEARAKIMRLRGGEIHPRPPCWLYFAKSRRGNIKIGVSDNPRGRISQLSSPQTDFSYPVNLLAMRQYEHRGAALEAERLFHEDFADSRVRGEWFRPTTGLMQLVEVFHDNPTGPLF